MLWVKAFHIIFMVTWFSGLFYLPRLFVYHAMSTDEISIERFKIMERKLFFGIMTPGALLTLLFGAWLVSYNVNYYLYAKWFILKVLFVLLTLAYHSYLFKLLLDFKKNKNQHSHLFYRWVNEIPVIFLIFIIILVIVKPWGIV